MKVRITMTVDIDPVAWIESYPGDLSKRDVRGDVQRYAINAVLQSPGIQECSTRRED